MVQRPLADARVIVTGASSGIGRAISLQLADAGAKVVVAGRRGTRLEKLVAEIEDSGGAVRACAGDITCQADRIRLIDACREGFGGLDILINNAGVGMVGPFADSEARHLRQLMEVNFFAAVEMARQSLPLLRQGRHPLLVNIGSVLGYYAVPKKSEYCASKFALRGFSDALRAEWQGEGIGVLLVSPSTTASEFSDKVLSRSGPAAFQAQPMTAEQVARQTLRAIQRGRHELTLSSGGRWMARLHRFAPQLARFLVTRYG